MVCIDIIMSAERPRFTDDRCRPPRKSRLFTCHDAYYRVTNRKVERGMQNRICVRSKCAIRDRRCIAPILGDHIAERAPLLSGLRSLGARTLDGRPYLLPRGRRNLIRLVKPPAVDAKLID